MGHAVVDALTADGRLHALVGQAAVDSLEPMCGVGVSLVGPAPLPWAQPPAGIAIVSLAEANEGGFQGVAWIGGNEEGLASVAELLTGERPGLEDEMLQDCVRELGNILAGRIQEQLHAAGLSTGLGLPLYISGARSLNVGASLVDGVAVQIRLDLPDAPDLIVGFAAKES